MKLVTEKQESQFPIYPVPNFLLETKFWLEISHEVCGIPDIKLNIVWL